MDVEKELAAWAKTSRRSMKRYEKITDDPSVVGAVSDDDANIEGLIKGFAKAIEALGGKLLEDPLCDGTGAFGYLVIKKAKKEKWDRHDRYYAAVTLQLEDPPGWHIFAGRCLLTGIGLDLSIEEITEYLFESVHGLGITEIPLEVTDLRSDMALYFKAKKEKCATRDVHRRKRRKSV